MTCRIRWPWHNGMANKKLCTWTPSVQASDSASLRDTIPNPRGQTDLETDNIFLFSDPNLGQWPELTSHLCSARNAFWSFFDPALHSPRAMDRPQSAAPWPDHGKRSGSACSGVILLRNLRTLGALPKGLQFFLGIFSRFLGFDGFDWYLQRFAAKLSDLHGVVVVVVGWMDG